jgi:hypothetical protein
MMHEHLAAPLYLISCCAHIKLIHAARATLFARCLLFICLIDVAGAGAKTLRRWRWGQSCHDFMCLGDLWSSFPFFFLRKVSVL